MRVRSTLLLCLSLALASPAAAQDTKEAAPAFYPPGSLLFAQSAAEMRYEGDQLTLGGIAPATLYFSDRPNRLAGVLSNQAFVDLWTQGQDSFAADPPNAALALLEESDKPPVAVELISVALEEGNLVYKIRILDGDLPAQSGPVSLFIDHFFHHHHWGGPGFGPGFGGWGWGPGGFGAWGPGFGPTWDSGFSSSVFGCGMNSYMGTLHACF